ncbi:MAG: MFS transporter [Steroidobacteraceae bacterium]|nr:MFS transporter [Steroidobacteraceae bacterium]
MNSIPGIGPVRDPAAVTAGYRRYVLGLLLVVYIVNFVDRQVLAVLIEPIKRELELSDTQLGFLSGLAFAMFYVTFGIPLARIADRRSRRDLIAVCMVAWSAMTALCGLAANFAQLLAARVGVAVGEAGCVAPAHSIISDYYPPERRAFAISVFSSGASIGIFVGLMLGGWLSELYGWRITLVLIGLPGILVALVVLATLREPIRGMTLGAGAAVAQAPGRFWEDIGRLAGRHSLMILAVATGLQSMVIYGTASWLPAFYMRVHEMKVSEAGTMLALINGLGAGVGAVVGGSLAGVLARRDHRWLVWTPAIATALATPMYLVAVMAPDASSSLLALAPASILGAVYAPAALAAAHGLSGSALRATGIAVMLFVSNILGIGGGALLVGIVSDLFAGAEPTLSLRYGLVVVLFANVLAVVGYLWASRHLLRDWQD